jgi:hypothetical protein
MFRIVCGNGPCARKYSTVEVTPEFAESAGWAAPPLPSEQVTPFQLQAAQTFQRAQQGPVQPLELMTMVQTAVDTALARAKTQESGLDSFMRGFSAANELSLKAMDQAKAMLGMNPTQSEPKEASWADVVLQVAPTILEGLKSILAQPPQAQPVAVQVQTQQATLPSPKPEVNTVSNQNVYPIPPEETRPLIGLMRQYADMIRPHLESSVGPQDLAAQLSGLVGEALDPSIIATAQYVKVNGHAILGNIAPFFATEKAAQVVIEWAAIIAAEQES